MKLPFLAAVAAILTWCALDARSAETTHQFPHPERIRYDGQCLTIEGKDTFIFSGAFHYFRCPKELWADRFQTIKDAGFNAVESYVPWNWHEREMPAALDDFSKVDLRDLDDWLSMAEKFGFYVIIRPGPYICAEWDSGAYPRWLLTKKPESPRRKEAWLRSDDPVYLAWSKHWYDAVCPVIAKHQITRQKPGAPGVILFQIENEYTYSRLPTEAKENQLRALAEVTKAQGIDVPLFTCLTQPVRGSKDPLLSQVFDSCNFYPRWNVDGIRRDIEKLRRDQPDAPSMTTELQGGWFAEVGGKLSEQQDGMTGSQIQNLTLFAIQNGNTITNYYMLFGGTNFDDWSARLLPTTYDYAAPIREGGGVGERYARIWAVGHMLREHGPKLARAVPVACDVTAPDKDVQGAIRRAPDGSRYIFIRTNQHNDPRKGEAHFKEKDNAAAPELVVPYDLEPFGSQVLYLAPGVSDSMQGKWLPEPKPVSAPQQPLNQPKAVEFTRVTRRDDPLPEKWTLLNPGQGLEEVGVFDSHPVYYRVAAKPGMRLDVALRHGDGVAAASAAGKLLPRAGEWAGNAAFSLPAAGDAATRAVLLYDNAGRDNIDLGIEAFGGIQTARVSAAGKLPEMDLAKWEMGTPRTPVGAGAISAKTLTESVEKWQPANVSGAEAKQIKNGETALFRAQAEIGAEQLAAGQRCLKFSRLSDRGAVFVNGELLGETAGWAARGIAGRLDQHVFDAAKLLHVGSNEILVLVQVDNRTGGLGPVRLGAMESDAEPMEIAAGSEREHGLAWSQAGFDDSAWQEVKPGQEAVMDAGGALLTWQRMEFEMPSPQAGVWTPWHVRLEASGNGFIYLNGHCLGRHWQAGPQRDFYLPECWLNFGPGKKNVLAVSLRPLDKGAAIHTAQIVPEVQYTQARSAH